MLPQLLFVISKSFCGSIASLVIQSSPKIPEPFPPRNLPEVWDFAAESRGDAPKRVIAWRGSENYGPAEDREETDGDP